MLCVFLLIPFSFLFFLIRDPVWARNYPIHKCAYEGDVAGINARLSQFSHSMKDDKSASPIHYAAW